jgi:hypothetical protein
VDPVHIAIFAAAIPAAVSAAVFLVLRRLRRGAGGADAGVGIAAGFLAGFAGVGGLPSFPILDAWRWLFFIALAGGALAVIASRVSDPPEAIRWTLRAALAVFAAWATVGGKSAVWLAGVFAATIALVWFADGVARRTGPSTFLAATLVVATGTAVSTGVSNFAMLGQVAGGLCAALGACLLLSWFVPVSVRGAVALVGVLVAAIALNGFAYADLPAWSAALLGAAAPAAWLAAIFSESLPGRRRSALVVAAAAVFAGAAVAVAVASSEPLVY